jgi:hypothetical protein
MSENVIMIIIIKLLVTSLTVCIELHLIIQAMEYYIYTHSHTNLNLEIIGNNTVRKFWFCVKSLIRGMGVFESSQIWFQIPQNYNKSFCWMTDFWFLFNWKEGQRNLWRIIIVNFQQHLTSFIRQSQP